MKTNIENRKPQSEMKELLELASSANTKKSYSSDIKHYQEAWQGFLPASRAMVGEYLAHYAKTLKVSTLQRRCSALRDWHLKHGFSDPTDSKSIRELMKGIRKKYNQPADQAEPLTLSHLSQIIGYLDSVIVDSQKCLTDTMETKFLSALRDKSMILMGFWRGFRADTLVELQQELIKPKKINFMGTLVNGLEIYLPYSKGDRLVKGDRFPLPSLSKMPKLCPVSAYQEWINASDYYLSITENDGSSKVVYGRFEKKGEGNGIALTRHKMRSGSLAHWLPRLCKKAGIENYSEFSSHSMRRGLATFMHEQHIPIENIMHYIGWRSVSSAMKYLDLKTDGVSQLLSLTDKRE
ncbi:Tyrosine recombinase XerD [invertebrate metagenome]|uniref:Tyrosine recombinase XerD n=1 Tax=invertebrate metagenome TaxID=1711999 RepID=A0A2H9T2P0_9ZZZZ